MKQILVINPNSSAEVTSEIDRAVAALRSEQLEIRCIRLEQAPAAIASQRDADAVVPLLLEAIAGHEESSDAFIVACYSDPGLFSAREATDKPVFGSAQCALALAATLGERTGVISISEAAVARHMAYARAIQQDRALVADVSVDLTVAELQNDAVAFDKMLITGRLLLEKHDARVIVLGCAGMARHRVRLEQMLGVPVVDPTQAAVGMAAMAVQYDYKTVAR